MGNDHPRARYERCVAPAHVERDQAIYIVVAIGMVLMLIGLTHILLEHPAHPDRVDRRLDAPPPAAPCRP